MLMALIFLVLLLLFGGGGYVVGGYCGYGWLGASIGGGLGLILLGLFVLLFSGDS
jgi:hypothetical protein